MNTANLELQGLYLAMAAINDLLVEKSIVTHPEIRDALSRADAVAGKSPAANDLSNANRQAIHFPLRFLSLASEKSEGGNPVAFHSSAKHVAERGYGVEGRAPAGRRRGVAAAVKRLHR